VNSKSLTEVMQKRTQRADLLSALNGARYALLRTYQRDGTAVDTPIWFDIQAGSAVFRTKIGPKTKRLAACPDVELIACDHRGRVRRDANSVAGRGRFCPASRRSRPIADCIGVMAGSGTSSR
jgi:PPOX class probable F420-dependent enzyme